MKGVALVPHHRPVAYLAPILVFLAALGDAPAGAEEAVVYGESPRTAQRLEEVAKKEAAARQHPSDERWAEVVNDLQALLASSASDLVPLKGNGNLLVPARWLCHARIAGLPPDALRLYRGRADGPATRWLEQGARTRDTALLRRVVDEAFCSRPARAALDLLGDLAFERGHFAAAERWWRMLAPLPDGNPSLPHYPDAAADAPRSQAKQLLARWFGSGSTHPDAWRRQLAAFRKRYPMAAGYLAGATGIYWKRLEAVAATERPPTESDSTDANWPTFAGAAERNRVLPGAAVSPSRLSGLCRYGQHWQFQLETGAAARSDRPGKAPIPQRPSDFGRTLAFHPAVVGRHVLVADGRRVTAFNLDTGKRERWYDAGGLPLSLTLPPDLRTTLTVAGDCVLARLGVQGLRPDRDKEEITREGSSSLVCLNLRPGAGGDRLRWRVTPDAAPSNAAFEGTAVAGGDCAFIAVTRFDRGRAITAIHCYPLDARGVAAPRWKQDVCASRELAPGQARFRHHLLTLAGGQVVYCSHAGAIVALDAATGRRAWALRYRSGREPGDDRPLAPRDLAPCVYDDGRLYVAPTDTDQLLCLDAANGQLLWSRERIEAVSLLGVGQGRLIFTTMTPQAGLRAVSAADGGDRGGWFRTSAGGTDPLILFGRGFLAGDLVYWPTYNRVYALRQKDGDQPSDPSLLHAVPPGNLAFGSGALVVAGKDTLHIFAPPATRLQERMGAVRERPDSALAHYFLGAAQADAGLFEKASENFLRAGRLARREDRLDGQPFPTLIRRERQEVLLRSADCLRKQKRWPDAAALLMLAAGPDFSPAERLRALAALSELWLKAGEIGRAAAVCHSILGDRTLQREHLADANGNPQSARCWALAQLDRLVGLPISEWLVALDGTLRGSEQHRTDGLPLSLPLLRRWHVEAAAGERFLLPAFADAAPHRTTRVFSLRGSPQRILRCRNAVTGKVLWEQPVLASAVWLGKVNGTLIVGGAEGVRCLDLKGASLWEYSAPAWGQQRPPLSAFRLASSRLFFLQGGRRLFALESATGRILWTHEERSAFLQPPDVAGRFAPGYRVGAETVELPGAGWCLNSRTGRKLYRLGPESVREVSRRAPASGKVLWKHEIPEPTTLTGEVPQVVGLLGTGAARSCLLIVARNYGATLQRLDEGKPRWSRPPLFRSGPLWTPGISADADAIYFVHEGALRALALEDGRQRWAHPLSASSQFAHWRTLRAGDYVVAWPARTPEVVFPMPPMFGSFAWGITLPPEERLGAGFPVLLCDCETGKLVQRLNLPAGAPRLWLRWKGTKGENDGEPSVTVTPSGLVVLLGKQVWGLTDLLQTEK